MGVVLVGVDLSETSMRALERAIQEATWREAKVVVLHVLALPAYMAIEPGAFRIDVDEVRAAAEETLEGRIEDLRIASPNGFPVEVEYEVAVGHPGTQILEMASDRDAELVVLGSRGLGGFKGLLLGSVTTYAIHHLDRELLIVPGNRDEEGSG